MVNFLQMGLRGVRRAIELVIILLFVYMTVSVIVQVIGRYVFNFSIASAVETATFAQIWMVLLAAGTAMRWGLHVSVDILVAQLPSKVVRAINVPITLVCLWFLWIIFDGSFRLLEIGEIQSSPVLRIPMYYPYLAIPVAAAYLALEFVIVMWTKTFGDPSALTKEHDERAAL